MGWRKCVHFSLQLKEQNKFASTMEQIVGEQTTNGPVLLKTCAAARIPRPHPSGIANISGKAITVFLITVTGA